MKDEKSFAWECTIGHNSPPQFCRSGAVGIKTLASGAEVVLAPSAHDHALYRNSGATIIRQWNLTKSSNHSFACHETPAFFINIPYSNTFDGKVNYYHYHVDVLLPLFVAFQRASLVENGHEGALVSAVVIPTVSTLQWHSSTLSDHDGSPFEWDTQAFKDPKAHWVQSLQTMTDFPLMPFSSTTDFRGIVEEGRRIAWPCFSSAYFGLPSVEHPAPSTVRRFVEFMRSRLKLRAEPVPCDASDEIGLVRRSNRRLLLNEADLIKAVANATGATIRLLDFGKNGFRADIASMQTLRVLIGIQGSGLINGWYLPPQSGVVVLYQYGAWDVFDEYLSPRGPYAFWANGDPAKSFCNRTVDRFCDSPDTIVDIGAAVEVIYGSLMASRRHCSAEKEL